MSTHISGNMFSKVTLMLLVTVTLLLSAPVVAFAEGGGAAGDGAGASSSTTSGGFIGSVAAAIGKAAAGMAAAVGNAVAAVGNAVAAVANAAVGMVNGLISSKAAAPASSASYSQAQLDKAPTVANAQGLVKGYQTSTGFAVVDQSNGNGLAAVAPGEGGIGGGGGGVVGIDATSTDSCPSSNYKTIACTSSTNACGDTASGTRQQCYDDEGALKWSTRCSAEAPALPSYVGTPCTQTFTDICGYTDTAYGAKDCSNTCAITYWPPVPRSGLCTPDVCRAGFEGTPPNCVRSVCPAGTTGDYPNCTTPPPPPPGDPRVSVEVIPTIVTPGDTAMVTWSTKDVSGCTVDADTNADTWSARSGREETRAITTRATYTVSCEALSGETLTESATVYIVPNWQEI